MGSFKHRSWSEQVLLPTKSSNSSRWRRWPSAQANLVWMKMEWIVMDVTKGEEHPVNIVDHMTFPSKQEYRTACIPSKTINRPHGFNDAIIRTKNWSSSLIYVENGINDPEFTDRSKMVVIWWCWWFVEGWFIDVSSYPKIPVVQTCQALLQTNARLLKAGDRWGWFQPPMDFYGKWKALDRT